MIKICPRCKETYATNDYDEDYVHKCSSGSKTLDEEDRVVIGPYISEETGDLSQTGTAVHLQGTTDKSSGKRKALDDVHLPIAYTLRGKHKKTHRQRKHFHMIDFSKD